MKRSSILKSVFFLGLVCFSSIVAQERKQWSFGGAVGTTNDMILSYDVTPQIQVSVVSSVIMLDGNQSWNDRIGFSVIYFFDTSDAPFFVGFSPGITYDASEPFIAIVPFGVQRKIAEDVTLRIAAVGFHTSRVFSDATGIGISIGVSKYF